MDTMTIGFFDADPPPGSGGVAFEGIFPAFR